MFSPGKVSIITPCYKFAHYLPLAVESALGQTYRNVEVVVVNDGSPDNTSAVMQKYLNDPRIVYIEQENGGVSRARNNAIARSTGEFIAFLDADDIWDATKLERQMPLFADPAVGLVYCRLRLMDENGQPVFREDNNPFLQPRAGYTVEHLVIDNFVPTSGTVIRKAALGAQVPFDPSLKMAEDWDLWLRLCLQWKFDYVDDVLLSYRVGHSGQASKNYERSEKDSWLVMERFLKTHDHGIDKKALDFAYAYSYCNRANYYRRHSLNKALGFYSKAIARDPGFLPAYKGVLKLLPFRLLAALGAR